MSEIVNRIANSPIITFKLENYHTEGERVLIDIKDQLFHGMILREKDFRAWVREHDWSQYQDKHVAITCSVEDVIIQVWAWMLLEVKLQPFAKNVVFGTLEDLEVYLYMKELDKIDYTEFQDRPVVIKGCSDIKIPDAIFVEATRRIQPYVKKLSYGEPCSTVPVYKRPREKK
ncbi:MAG: DUF2480 family protein [Bacteroidota bacterium]